MDIQDIHGVSRIGSKLRQEIRRNTMSYHEKRHYFWKKQAYALWCVVALLLCLVILW